MAARVPHHGACKLSFATHAFEKKTAKEIIFGDQLLRMAAKGRDQ
jgi:hypothetical protein